MIRWYVVLGVKSSGNFRTYEIVGVRSSSTVYIKACKIGSIKILKFTPYLPTKPLKFPLNISRC